MPKLDPFGKFRPAPTVCDVTVHGDGVTAELSLYPNDEIRQPMGIDAATSLISRYVPLAVRQGSPYQDSCGAKEAIDFPPVGGQAFQPSIVACLRASAIWACQSQTKEDGSPAPVYSQEELVAMTVAYPEVFAAIESAHAQVTLGKLSKSPADKPLSGLPSALEQAIIPNS